MQAIAHDGGELSWQAAPEPQADAGEVLIDVRASAVNRADLLQAAGGYPPPPGASPILGLECAGVVAAVGEGVTRVEPGAAVCALLAGGGYAERVSVPAGQVLPMPTGLSFAEAAALPEVFATAYLNLFMEARLEPGESVLLHAGASGVGTAAIQLCRAFGNPSFVTAGGADKIEACTALGAAGGHSRHDGSFVDAVLGFAGDAGVDVILDPVGGRYLADNQACLGLDGRLVLIGLMGGASAELNMALMMMKRQRVIGSTLRARSVAYKAAVMDQLAQRVWPLVAAGDIKPIVHETVPMADAAAAHRLVATNDTVGKVLLALPGAEDVPAA
ncbi:MAG: NAD(P)H-quinone oxidoreductase [Pseudomonadota bacterium]